MDTIALQIEGMSCGHCVKAVRRALEGVDGVQIDDVAIGTATVRLTPGAVAPSAVVEAVTAAGYAARLVEAG